MTLLGAIVLVLAELLTGMRMALCSDFSVFAGADSFRLAIMSVL
jgi:hypothetical protein